MIPLLTMAAACDDKLEAISQVSKFRVLAVQTAPPEVAPGGSTTFSVLTADPAGEGRKVVGMGFVLPGLLTPSDSDVEEEIPFFWPLMPTAADDDGVIEFATVWVPPELGDHFPVDPCDEQFEAPLKATAVILICAGDGLDEAALLERFETMASETEDDADQSLDLAAYCTDAGADEGLTAMKTFTISDREPDDPLRNTNPKIDRLYFVGGEGTEANAEFEFDEVEDLLPPRSEGGHGTYECTGGDDCRNPASVELWLTEDTPEQEEQTDFCETEIIDERMYVSWFVDGGQFDVDRSGGEEPVGPYMAIWLPPREGGEFTLWAVAHDVRGGVSWQIYSIEAIPED